MLIKYLIFLGVSFLISCGGGSSSPTTPLAQSGASSSNNGQITDQLQIVE